MNEERIKMMRPCPTCEGQGFVNDPHCRECGQRLAALDDWQESAYDMLPCGHPAASLVEMVSCPVCDGNGRYPQYVPLAEWQRLRRRKIAIAIVLFIALLLPIAAVAAAVNDAYPGYVCGSWWYGIIVGFIFVSRSTEAHDAQ